MACFAKLIFFNFCETNTAKLIWDLFGTRLFFTLYCEVVRKMRFADFIVISAVFKRFLLQNLSFLHFVVKLIHHVRIGIAVHGKPVAEIIRDFSKIIFAFGKIVANQFFRGGKIIG